VTSNAELHPDRDEAARFLSIIAPGETKFTFQTFDDDPDRKSPQLVRVIHGTLAEHFDVLASLNAQGAGVFVTINATDLNGRKAENIVKVRAVASRSLRCFGSSSYARPQCSSMKLTRSSSARTAATSRLSAAS
jgi:hypothetical protein